VPLVLASHRIWREIEAHTGERLLDACGCLIMAPASGTAVHHGKSNFVDRSIASARAFDIPHETLTGAEVRRRFPTVAAADDTQAFLEPGGGFVYPDRCIAAQLHLAVRAGARIEQAAISSVSQRGGGVMIETAAGIIEAGQAVVAAGSWTGPLMGAPFDQLLTVSRQVLHWFPVEEAGYKPGRFPTMIWMHGDTDNAYFYAFPSLPGTGLLKAATEQYRIATTPQSVDRRIDPAESVAFHAEHLSGRLRGIGAGPARSTACLYTVTPDAGFIIDRHPRLDRVVVVSACSGHGFKHSAGIGEAVAATLSGAPAVSLHPFALSRFRHS
jgi:sarcosine oxidase